MTSIFSKVTDYFTDKNSKQKYLNTKKNIKQFINETDDLVNQLITILINDFLKDDKYLALQLLNSNICKDTAIYLSDNLEKQLKHIDINNKKILFQKEKINCNSYNSCSQILNDIKINSNDKISKKQICDNIAIFNIRIINLVAALLMNIDPSNNLAIKRMETLFKSINDDKELQINICQKKEDNTLLEQLGIKELLNLYMYNLLLNNNNVSLVNEYNNLVSLLAENLTPRNITQILFDDVKIATQKIKKSLLLHHKKIIGEFKISNMTPTKDNTKTIRNTNNNNVRKLIQNEIQTKTFEEQKTLLNQQQKKLNNTSDTIKRQKELFDNQKEIISKQMNNITQIKKELELIKQNQNKTNSIDTKLKDLTTKLNVLAKQQNNSEIIELKTEIESLLQETKNQRINSQKGGATAETLTRFKEFINKYYVSDNNIKNSFFDLFNRKFKLPESVNTICENVNEDNVLILPFNSNDIYINKYLNIYNNLSSYYMSKTQDMVNILEKELLEIKYNPDNTKVIELKIRKLTEKQLLQLESKVRNLLNNYISDIHIFYIEGISALNEYLALKK